MNIKHYTDIKLLDDEIEKAYKPGDLIYIEEKIDGANFSVRYDAETDSLKGFSRRNEISPKVTMNRAYKYLTRLDKDLYKSVLGNKYGIFMEWLNPHLVNYPKAKYFKPYAFDVFDFEKHEYLPQSEAMKIAEQLNVEYVPVFYVGPFISWDHVRSFVGKTALGGESGEGVVVKNQTNTRGPYNMSNNYTKVVAQAYEEKKYTKIIDEDKLQELELSQKIAESIVTEARIKKILCKLVDEGILREDWDESDQVTLLKHLPREVYMDCMKEEPELLKKAGKSFGGFSNKIVKGVIADIIAAR